MKLPRKKKKQRESPKKKSLGTSVRGLSLTPSIHHHPFLKTSQVPEDLPREENQEPPPEDEWDYAIGNNSPCLFVQYQDELERHVDIMYPAVTNKQKRYHMYRHMLQGLHGHLGKGKRKPLPGCFTQGLRELFPSEDYVGFKPSPFESGPHGDYDRECDDGSTYDNK